VIDKEGKRNKDGTRKTELKIMGMETQRSDTPSYVQDFLEECIGDVLRDGKDYWFVRNKVEEFKKTFFERDPWQTGRPCRVKNLTPNTVLLDDYENRRTWQKPRVHFSVMASYNFNKYKEFFNDLLSMPASDGDKVEVFELLMDNKHNPLKLESIGVPVGATHIADWVKNLPIDVKGNYKKLVVQKATNVFDMLNWEFDKPINTAFVFED
jgi:hypothetical protein